MKGWGKYLLEMRRKMQKLNKKALLSQSASGGYLVPPQFQSELLKMLEAGFEDLQNMVKELDGKES